MKICKKCFQELPLVAFTKSKQHAGGLYPWCGKCKATYKREAYAELHPQRQRKSSEGMLRIKKVCIDCIQELPVSHFHRKRTSFDGKMSYCKECANARSVKWQRDNKVRLASKRLAERQSSPRWSLAINLKGRLAHRPTDNPATTDDVMSIWEEQGGRCALSGIVMTWAKGKILPTSITIDRIDTSRGYQKDNIRLLCHAVNSFRGTMSDEDMFTMALALIGNMKRPKLRLVS